MHPVGDITEMQDVSLGVQMEGESLAKTGPSSVHIIFESDNCRLLFCFSCKSLHRKNNLE